MADVGDEVVTFRVILSRFEAVVDVDLPPGLGDLRSHEPIEITVGRRRRTLVTVDPDEQIDLVADLVERLGRSRTENAYLALHDQGRWLLAPASNVVHLAGFGGMFGTPVRPPTGACYRCEADPAHHYSPDVGVEWRAGLPRCPQDGTPLHFTDPCPES